MKFFILSITMLFTLSLSAQDYHVSLDGDDDNPGSLDQPWESIQYAMDVATAGSTVHIHAGVYETALYVNVSGVDGNYIEFRNYENDEVIIDAGNETSYAVIEIYNVHHITINGLIIRNHQQLDAVGILVEEACDHIRIENCEIYDINFSTDPEAEVTEFTNAQPIAVYGTDSGHIITDLQILNNEIHDCQLGFSEALVVNGNVQFFNIEGNHIHDVTNIGIDIIGHEGTCDDPELDQARLGFISGNITSNCQSPYATSAGIYVDGGRDLVIERNLVFNNQWGIEIGCENIGKSTSNIIVRNNIVYGNQTAGIQVGGYDYPTGSGKVTDCKILNNTFYGNDTEEDWTGEIYITYNEALLISRNIFHATNANAMLLSTEDLVLTEEEILIENNNFYAEAGEAQFYFNFNDYDGLSAFEGQSNVNENLSLNSEFISTGSSPDLRLSATSPLIDQGDDSSLIDSGLLDFDGENRVENGTIDIGADEFGSSDQISEIEFKSLVLYPNPCTDKLNFQGDYSLVNSIVEIRSFEGKLMKSLKVQSNSIDISDLKSGIYLVQILLENGDQITEKVIKE